MQREPSLIELKEERRKLESDLMSATGRNQLHISTLPNEVSRFKNNRSIHSPVLNNTTVTAATRHRVTPSPPSSAQRSRHQSPSLVSNIKPITTNSNTMNKITTSSSQYSSNSTSSRPVVKPRSPLVLKQTPIVPPLASISATSSTGPRSTQVKSSVVNTKVTNNTSNGINSTGSSMSNDKSSRPDSVDDSSLESSSVSSLSSSSHNRVNSAQKFRQMVFDWRD